VNGLDMTVYHAHHWRYSAFEMWWHKWRNQILSFPETDESI